MFSKDAYEWEEEENHDVMAFHRKLELFGALTSPFPFSRFFLRVEYLREL